MVGTPQSPSACNVTASIICATHSSYLGYPPSLSSNLVLPNGPTQLYPLATRGGAEPQAVARATPAPHVGTASRKVEVNNGRTSESLRSKAAQLRRKIRRRRAIHPKRPQPSSSTARSARRRQEDVLKNLSMMQIPTPPVLGLTPRCRKLQAAILQGSQYQRDQLQTPRLPQELQDRGLKQHLSSIPEPNARPGPYRPRYRYPRRSGAARAYESAVPPTTFRSKDASG